MKKIKTFKGSYFGFGYQQGEIYKKNGMSFDGVRINKVLYQNQLKIYQKFYPEALEELEGIAIGGGFDKDKVIYSFLTTNIYFFTRKFKLKLPVGQCTIFGVKTPQEVYVGRNLDWLEITEKFFQIYKVFLKGKNSYLAVSDMGIGSDLFADSKYQSYCPNDLINDKGLYIGENYSYNPRWSYGLTYFHMIRLISETCSTVNEAIEVLMKVPLDCPKNFFIADKKGNMVVIEHAEGLRFKTRYPENNVIIVTNHYLDPDLAKEDIVLKYLPTHNTYLRYYETLYKINQKKNEFRFSDIISILGDINSYVCQNNFINNVKIRTIWTLALDMINKKYKIYWDLFGKRKEKELKI